MIVKSLSHAVFASSSLAVLMALAAPAAAETHAATYAFNIPAQDLSSALRAYAQTTRQQVSFDSAVTAGRRSTAVSGRLAADAALQGLLAGTGLESTRTGRGVILVRPASVAATPAASVESDPVGLDEVVVTAQKRAERLLDVPVPVTAVTGRTLVQDNTVRITDYARRIPGLTVSGASLNQISLRGVTTGGGTTNPTIAVTIDGLPVTSAMGLTAPTFPDLDPSDLARIEVLRGPQGTLYGAASLGGLINLVTESPSTHDYGGRVEVGANTIKGGTDGWSGRASVNLPLWQDKLALRVSAFRRDDPAYLDSVNPRYLANDVNKLRTDGMRAAVRFTPIDGLAIEASHLEQTIRTRAGPVIVVTPYPTDYRPTVGYYAGSTTAGAGENVSKIDSVRVEYKLPFATLTSASGWSTLDNRASSDVTIQLPFVLTRASGLGPLIPNAPAGATVRTDNRFSNEKFSQELRLASDPDARFSWQVGAFYTKEDLLVAQKFGAFDASGGLLAALVDAPTPLEYEERAVFASATYKVTDRFDVQVGARYSENEQQFRQGATVAAFAVPVFGPSLVNQPLFTSKDDAFTWNVSPRFRINADMMVYGRIATGYRPGGPNTAAGAGLPYEPDRVTNYEAGFKGYVLDRAVTIDTSLFWIDWTNIQLAGTTVTNQSFMANGGGARSRGLEFAGEWRLARGWSLSGNVAYTDAELTDAIVPPTPTTISLVGGKGTQLPFAPKFASNLGVQKTVELPGDWRATAAAHWSHVGARNSALRSTAPAAAARRQPLRIPSYDVVDLRLTITDGDWEATVYARNLGAGHGIIAIGDNGGVSAVTTATFLQPRTVGVSLARNF